jgi:hypothetical protein
VLYVSKEACSALSNRSEEKTTAAGVRVTPEACARALVYQGLGLAPDGVSARSARALDPEVRRELIEIGAMAQKACGATAAPVLERLRALLDSTKE